MADHVLVLVAAASPTLPARICALLAQRQVEVSSIQMTRPAGTSVWSVQLIVTLESDWEVELAAKRLTRLVDVLQVEVVSDA